MVLDGEPTVLARLAEWFPGPNLAVVKQDDEYHLVSETMETFSELREVDRFADEQLALLNSYARFIYMDVKPISITGTIETSGGVPQRYRRVTASFAASYGVGLAPGPDPLREAVLAAATTQRLSQVLATNDDVKRVLKYWLRCVEEGRSEPCLAMRRLLEVLGGKKWKTTVGDAGWARRREVEALGALLHDEELSGPKALHAYSKGDKRPTTKMTLSEAHILVQRIVMQYLLAKAKE